MLPTVAPYKVLRSRGMLHPDADAVLQDELEKHSSTTGRVDWRRSSSNIGRNSRSVPRQVTPSRLSARCQTGPNL